MSLDPVLHEYYVLSDPFLGKNHEAHEGHNDNSNGLNPP
jgi:hypothetical protein